MGDQRPPAAGSMWPPPTGGQNGGDDRTSRTDEWGNKEYLDPHFGWYGEFTVHPNDDGEDAPPGGNYTSWDRWLIQNFGTLEFNLLDLAGTGPSAGNRTNKTNGDQLPSNDPDIRNFTVGGSWWFFLFGDQKNNSQQSNQSPFGADIVDTIETGRHFHVIIDADSNVYYSPVK
jgi:hypothetical protein